MAPVSTQRDLRLDLFRGFCLWLIFLDHIPSNAVSWITIRNYGFSDATEIFVFISGYTAAFVYGRCDARARLHRRRRPRAQARLADLRRPRLPVRDLSRRDRLCRALFRQPALHARKWACSISSISPDVTIIQALLLKFKPVNMDVLPLYIVLLRAFRADPVAVVAPAGARRFGLSAALYAVHLGISAGTSRPGRRAYWVFNPVRLAIAVRVRRLVRARRRATKLKRWLNSPVTLALAVAYLVFALSAS